MAHESFLIEINGEEVADIYEDLISLEVELSDELPATCKLSLALYKRRSDGTWMYLDEERFRLWNRIVVQIGFVESGREELISGYVTQVTASFDPDQGQSVLEILGMDGSVRMDREEKLKDWPNKKDSDIATEIFGLYGFTPEVEDTAIIHDEALSTVIQRETDLQFLKRLALRNGFNCYVEGTTGYFRPVPADDRPQPALAAHSGEETNLNRFSISVDALQSANVAMFQVDRLTKEVLTAEVEESETQPLGELDAGALLGTGMAAAKVFVAKNAATGTPEMTALCQGLYQEGTWFVTGEGEIDAAAYEHVLKPRGLVTINGVANTYRGVYYVSYVRHVVSRESYTQSFRVKRNALLPTGDEDFSSTSSPGGRL